MKPRTAVTITQVSQGTFNDSIILSATTAYLNKSTITAPIASFVTRITSYNVCYTKLLRKVLDSF